MQRVSATAVDCTSLVSTETMKAIASFQAIGRHISRVWSRCAAVDKKISASRSRYGRGDAHAPGCESWVSVVTAFVVTVHEYGFRMALAC